MHCMKQDVQRLNVLIGPVPRLDKSKFTVRIDGFVEHQVEYTLEDIKSKFAKVEVVAALEVRQPLS